MNFLDSEKLERGQLFCRHDRVVSVSITLEVIVELFRVIAEQKEITIEALIEKGLFTRVDPSVLDRVLNNLLDNGSKIHS